MRKITKFLTMIMCMFMVFPAVGCGDGKVPEGSTAIKFWYNATISENQVLKRMVETYNKGQGVEDKVYVTTDNRKNIDKTSLFNDAPNVLSVDDTVFKGWAVEDLFQSLDSYYVAQSGLYTEEGITESLTNRYRLNTTETNGKRIAGAGAELLGLPFGSEGMVHYYSISAFEKAKINIISVAEKDLDGTGKYANVKPHGYAEYKNSPYEGAVSSVNIAGETVYKVYNNRIAVNWEEQRYLLKTFTKSYNATSPTPYGINCEWWFQYGWSVGGDCIGYDGSKYEFTIADKKPNYMVTVTDGVTVNNNIYEAGQIITYEDKANDSNISTMDGLYQLPSQYDALLEFIRITTPKSKQADAGVYGYEIGTYRTSDKVKQFCEGNTAILAGDRQNMQILNVSFKDKYNIAPTVQYRAYDGGSTYQKDKANGFENEYLKVIGNTYDGNVFTGDIKKVNGTQILGEATRHSSARSLVIPKKSDSEKYEAAWKFIRWAASEAGQEIYCETGITPNQTKLSYSDKYISLNENLNYWAFANAADNGDIGDWAYFENGAWVTDWAGEFNNQLRAGYSTIQTFIGNKKPAADNAIKNVSLVMKGRR